MLMVLKWCYKFYGGDSLSRFSVTTPEDLHEWIREESERRGISMNSIVVLALERYRDQGDKSERELLDEILKHVQKIK